MSVIDRSVFDPLPDNKETEFRKSMPHLSKMADNIDEAPRPYVSHMFSKREEAQLHLIYNYFHRNNIDLPPSIDVFLANEIIPQLSIIPFLFEGNMFYMIQTKEIIPYLIFSEADIRPFFRNYSFKTCLPHPNEQELTAILSWHHNNISNIKKYYNEMPPMFSYHVQALRTLPYVFLKYYKTEWQKTSSVHSPIDFSKDYQKLYALLHAPNEHLTQKSIAAEHSIALQYATQLLGELKYLFDGEFDKLIHQPRIFKNKEIDLRDHNDTLRVLWAISNGNLSALSALHNMFATIYLGQAYVNTQKNVTILLCKDADLMGKLIKTIFNSHFAISKSSESFKLFNHLYAPPIYTEYTASHLCTTVKTSTLLRDEFEGNLVNISIQRDNNDLDQLKTFSLKKTLQYENDTIFKGISHHPSKHYIHIMEEPPVDIAPNMQLIELMGDITGKECSLSNLDAAVIVLLSIFNFFTPTPLPKQGEAPSSHRFATEEEIVRSFIEDLFDDTTSKFTAEQLEEAVEKWMDENNTTENFDSDISKSKNDDDRKKIADNIGISLHPYTITGDIETAFKAWGKSVPFSTGAINIIDSLKKLYHPLFYIKYHKAKSRINPDAPEKNVKVFYGLALKAEKLYSFPPQEEVSLPSIQERENSFFHYYETMIQNFLNFQPQIYKILAHEESQAHYKLRIQKELHQNPEWNPWGLEVPKDLVQDILIEPNPNDQEHDTEEEKEELPPTS